MSECHKWQNQLYRIHWILLIIPLFLFCSGCLVYLACEQSWIHSDVWNSQQPKLSFQSLWHSAIFGRNELVLLSFEMFFKFSRKSSTMPNFTLHSIIALTSPSTSSEPGNIHATVSKVQLSTAARTGLGTQSNVTRSLNNTKTNLSRWIIYSL